MPTALSSPGLWEPTDCGAQQRGPQQLIAVRCGQFLWAEGGSSTTDCIYFIFLPTRPNYSPQTP
jgi:hypothetical protein